MGENGVLGGGGMTPADVAAVMRNNGYGDSWGGNCWWIVILFLAMMWGGNGWGNNGFQNAIGYENLATSNEVQRGFDNQNSMANQRDILAAVQGNALQEMQNSNQNTQYMMNAFNDKYNELQRDIAGVAMGQQQAIFNQQQCCCDIKQTIMAEGNATRAMLQQDKIESLQQRVNDLNLQAQMAGVVRYPMSTAYNAGFNPFCNCGNGMGCCA